MNITVGRRLGRYEIRSKIGEGGMGEVYLAEDTTLQRQVAIKFLAVDSAADELANKRLLREAQSAAKLDHPNICAVHECAEADGRTFIVMPYIEGETLAVRIKRQDLGISDTLTIAARMADALAEAHTHGIIHRDIKPANIIITPRGLPKVMDFGLAKRVNGATEPEAETQKVLSTPGAIVGTVPYMSPEQVHGQALDARSDIFSFGVVLYEMLTGQQPFAAATAAGTISAILTKEPPPLTDYVADGPEELQRIVRKCLEKHRERRYQTMRDVALDLDSYRRGEKKTLARAEPEIKSLAVLPLKPLDAGENYLGLGIADAVIRRISQTGGLIVRPTSAVRRYLTEDTDALAAAQQLNADTVLEGTVQRGGDRLRVGVNLLRVADGTSLWTDSFDLQMDDIFTIQDTVSQQVVSRLRLRLDPARQVRLLHRSTTNPVAYDFYLKALYNFDQRILQNKSDFETTNGFLEQAIEADPNFALAHAQLAYANAIVAVFKDPTEPAWAEQARAEIKRAEALDPQLAETHLVRFSLLASQYEGYQLESAVREVQLAQQINPGVGHGELGFLYMHMGLEDLAERAVQRALEIDPTSSFAKMLTLGLYLFGVKYDEWFAAYQKFHLKVLAFEASYFLSKGRLEEAERIIEQARSAKDEETAIQLPQKVALLYALKGDFRSAEDQIPLILAKHPVKEPRYHHATYDIACIYALQGKSADAVEWLRETAVTGFPCYPLFERDSYLDSIRKSQEFIQFLTEMKAEHDRFRGEFDTN